MITFVCPGCNKSHNANRAFAGLDARCIRCGTLIRIPTASGGAEALEPAGSAPPRPQSPAAPPNGNGHGPVKRRRPAADAPTGRRTRPAPVEDDSDFAADDVPPPRRTPRSGAIPTPPADEAEFAASGPPPNRLARGPVRAEAADTPPAPPPAPDPQIDPLTLAAAKKKRQYKIIGGSVAGAVAIAVAIAVFSGDEKKPVPPPDYGPPPAEIIVEQPKAVETPKVYEVAPPPRLVKPPVEYELNAAAFLQEYAEDPGLADLKYAGKGVLVRGVFHQSRSGAVVLAPDPAAPALTAQLALDPYGVVAAPDLFPGQPVAVRGTYAKGGQLVESEATAVEHPADKLYRDKPVYLTAAMVRAVNPPSAALPFPTVVLEPPATDSKVTVVCAFKVTDRDQLAKLKPGQRFDVRGLCSGRVYTTVRLENCASITPGLDAPGADAVEVSADQFHADYETDLLPGLRDQSLPPIEVSAEGLASAFQLGTRAANATYRYKPVLLSGTVKERRPDTRSLVIEAGTANKYPILVKFAPDKYAAIPEDKSLVVRGTCSGVVNGFVQIDSGVASELDPTAPKTTLDFLPYRSGKEHLYDVLQPGRTKDSPITRLSVRFTAEDLILVTPLKTGTYPGTSLFVPAPGEPKWTRDLTKLKPPQKPQARNYRVLGNQVEIGQVVPGERGEPAQYWEPVLRAEVRKGQSWSAKTPDGKLATFTVLGFGRDAAGADTVEIKRTVRNPLDPSRWEESAMVYVRGLGEVRRVVTSHSATGDVILVSEQKYVETAAPAPAELKSGPPAGTGKN